MIKLGLNQALALGVDNVVPPNTPLLIIIFL